MQGVAQKGEQKVNRSREEYSENCRARKMQCKSNSNRNRLEGEDWYYTILVGH